MYVWDCFENEKDKTSKKLQLVANLAGVEDQVGVKHLLDLLHQAHVDLTHRLGQIGHLAVADAVLAGDLAAQLGEPSRARPP